MNEQFWIMAATVMLGVLLITLMVLGLWFWVGVFVFLEAGFIVTVIVTWPDK